MEARYATLEQRLETLEKHSAAPGQRLAASLSLAERGDLRHPTPEQLATGDNEKSEKSE